VTSGERTALFVEVKEACDEWSNEPLTVSLVERCANMLASDGQREQELTATYRAELDKVSQRNYDLRMQAKQVAVPKGYVLVPIEPTPEMLLAAENTEIDPEYRSGVGYFTDGLEIYAAMLAAAPQPPQGEKS